MILLDGFDEIHTGATATERAHYLKRLLPLLTSPSPCIISTRPTYFTSFREMNTTLAGLLQPKADFKRISASPVDVDWLLGRLNISKAEEISAASLQDTIQLSALGEADVRRYVSKFSEDIRRATGTDEDALLAFLYRIYEIRDLLRRPLLLNMVLVTIVEGGLDITRSHASIGPSTLYELYTQVCARRDESKGRDARAPQRINCFSANCFSTSPPAPPWHR